MSLPKVGNYGVSLGADPEFFFTDLEGVAVPAEIVLGGEKGVAWGLPRSYTTPLVNGGDKVFVDGVQAEMNLMPSTCRQTLSSSIQNCISGTKYFLRQQKKEKEIKINLVRSTMPIPKGMLDKLSDKSKLFGCAPSFNTYDKYATIGVNPHTYPFRSAGGHIHFGANYPEATNAMYKNTAETIQILDYVLGNTCVLLDKDPLNAERRKNYGRAGEYRLPKHGLEYRALSNFWLRSYSLYSMVFSLARAGFYIGIENTLRDGAHFRALTQAVHPDKIREAIDTNNFDLAMTNYKKILPLVLECTDEVFLISPNFESNFDHFIEKGIDYWYPYDAATGWQKLWHDGPTHLRNAYGAENFMQYVVAYDKTSKDKDHWHQALISENLGPLVKAASF